LRSDTLISIPERFRSYRKLHGNINYCDQCTIIVMKQICLSIRVEQIVRWVQ